MHPSENHFQKAVEATADLSGGYKTGLSALGKYSAKISATSSRIEGSVDIDSCTHAKYPRQPRWDYVFAHSGKAYFVEVHSAHTSEVRTVVSKLQWLKQWLRNSAPEINRLKADKPYYWIQSKNFAIPKTSPQYKLAVKEGIKPIATLVLS